MPMPATFPTVTRVFPFTFRKRDISSTMAVQ